MTERFESDMASSGKIKKSVYRILSEIELCSIAVNNHKGIAHIATLYFAYTRNLQLYFISDKNSLHGKVISVNRPVAISIYDSSQPWDTDHSGLQLFGRCSRLEQAKSKIAKRTYSRRFSAYRDYAGALSSDEREASPYMFYQVHVEEVKVFDEALFGEETFVHARVRR